MTRLLLKPLADLVCRWPLLVVLAGVALAVVSAGYASVALRMNANTDDLIAPDRPFYADYRAFLDEFGDLEHIHVVIVDDGRRGEVRAAVDEVTRRLGALGTLPEVHGRISSEELLGLATRSMPDDDLADLATAAEALRTLRAGGGTAAAIREATECLERLHRFGPELTEAPRRELGASGLMLLSIVAGTPDADLAAPAPVYLTSDSGRLFFVLVRPDKDFSTLGLIEAPLRRIRTELDEVRADFPGLEIGLTGKPVLQADEMATTATDMTRAALLASVVVVALFMVFIGGVRKPLMAAVALACGVAWTFGLTTLAVGQLNLLSIVFTLVLVGIGIDFGVHLIARYNEERRSRSPQAAVTTALATAGRGNVTGALTSSLAFFMAMLTGFQGLRELGFIAGSGLLLCLLAMSTVLPALLVLFDGRAASGPTCAPAPVPLPASVPASRRCAAVLLSAAVMTVALAPFLPRLGFEENLLELQAKGLDSVAWEHRIIDDAVAATWFAAVTVDDLDEVEAVAAAALARPSVGAVRSVLDVIAPPSPRRDALRETLHRPPPDPLPGEAGSLLPAEWDVADLRRAVAALEMVTAGARLVDPGEARTLERLVDRLERLTAALAGADSEAAAATRAAIERRVSGAAGRVEAMLAGDRKPLRAALPTALRSTYMSPAGRYLVMIHPRENVWEHASMRRFIEDVRGIDPRVTGAPIAHFESLVEMKRSFVQAALLALLAVTLLVGLDFRRPGDTALALLPVLLGLLWTVEIMGLTGIEFNLANFFAVPILIGVGIDNGVHILHRFRESSHAGRLGSTRRAAILTSLTTMTGFGSLVIASHRGLQSLGLVMAIGSAACLVASVVVLPAVLAGRGEKTSKHRNVETSK